MIEYAFKFTCCSGLLFMVYHLALSQETFFQRNRIYLLAALLLSLLLPLFHFSFQEQTEVTIGYQLMESFHAGGEQAQWAVVLFVLNVEWYDVLWTFISLLLALRISWGIFKVFRSTSMLKKEKFHDHVRVYTDGRLPTFSFLHYLFFDNSLHMDELSKKSVLAHELIHIKQKHSWDLLLVQALKIVFWFNPFLFLYARALKEQHEFIVDAAVTKNIAVSDYQHAMVSVLFKNLNPGFVHSFNQSQIKKRIEKMNQMKTPRTNFWKPLLALPLVFCLMMTFSTEMVIAQSNDKVFEVADVAASPQGGIDALIKGLKREVTYPKEAKKNNVQGKVMVSFIVNTNGSLSDIKALNSLGHGCDEAAVTAVKNLGLKWSPAKKDGKVVRQRMTLPIAFSL